MLFYIEKLFGLIVVILFILFRILGKKSNPTPPRRGQRTPTGTQEEPDRSTLETEDVYERRNQSKRRPGSVAKEEPVDVGLFPIPGDLREIFGLPQVEKEEKLEPMIEAKREPKPEPRQVRKEMFRPSITTATEVFSPDTLTSTTGRSPSPVPGLKLPMEKNAVIQGIIWAEVLKNPHIRRARKYGQVGRV